MTTTRQALKNREQRGISHIRVFYDGFDPRLDAMLIEILETAGFQWYASGFDGTQRDVAFETPQSTDSEKE